VALMPNALAALYSYGDGLKRKMSRLISDPAGTVDLGARRFNEDQNALQNLFANAFPMGGDKTVLNSPQQVAKFQGEATDKALETYGGLMGATVWHGSPYKFNKFDSSKIGTGEGKQQQGMGAYLAESPLVGQKYADKESWKRGMDSGYLYKVEIPDGLASSMANHDAVLADQPKSVLNAVLPMLGDAEKKALRDYHGWDDPLKAPFAAVMDAMEIAKGNNRTATSEALRKSGIPGIRYLDGGSRGAGGGTSNYVVFPGNENLLQILERNGQAIK
jgi:hypothetical protein